MENTTENKAKFFAQYLGQILEYPEMDGKIKKHKLVGIGIDFIQVDYPRKIKGCVGAELSFKSNGNHNSDGIHAKIILKPLSSITEEDAIACGYDTAQRFVFLLPTELINREQCDYLRSKGYAVPYMGLSVEKLVDYGWITLKE